MCMGHEADQFSESVVVKNAFQVLRHILGNVPVTPEVLGTGENGGNGPRCLRTCIREHDHGRDAHGLQSLGKLVLKVAIHSAHDNGLAHQH